MSEPTLRREILDRVIRSRMEAQGIRIEDDWLDEYDCIDFDLLPSHLLGPAKTMRENALPLVDSIVGLIHRRLT